MEFIGIIGNRGSGKTNIMTAILKDYADMGVPVIANYKLNFDSLTMSFEDIRQIPELIEDAVIGLDELGMGADSYEFFSKDSKEITRLITQIRKRNCKVYYTVQRFGLINKRLRDQTDAFIMMRDMDEGVHLDTDNNIVVHHRDICNGIFEARFLNDDRDILNVQLFDGHPYWELYDTSEIIW